MGLASAQLTAVPWWLGSVASFGGRPFFSLCFSLLSVGCFFFRGFSLFLVGVLSVFAFSFWCLSGARFLFVFAFSFAGFCFLDFFFCFCFFICFFVAFWICFFCCCFFMYFCVYLIWQNQQRWPTPSGFLKFLIFSGGLSLPDASDILGSQIRANRNSLQTPGPQHPGIKLRPRQNRRHGDQAWSISSDPGGLAIGDPRARLISRGRRQRPRAISEVY